MPDQPAHQRDALQHVRQPRADPGLHMHAGDEPLPGRRHLTQVLDNLLPHSGTRKRHGFPPLP